MRKRLFAVFAALGLVVSIGGASAGSSQSAFQGERIDGREMAPPDSADLTHEVEGGHIAGGSQNMRKISRLKLGGASELTDVDERNGFAYIGTDYALCEEAGGSGNGVFVVDIRKPRTPKKVAFIPGAARVGEGVHAFGAKSPKFKGDLLLWSNETCDVEQHGGITVVDVTKPRDPKVLAAEVGDTDANDPEDSTPLEDPNDVHSVMGWSDDGKIYAIMTDNFEQGGLDVDIMDLTNPRRPRLIAETGIPEWPEINPQLAAGENPNQHDMMVKKIGGTWFAMISYWDAGWVLLNLNDPANPEFVDDFDYAANDPELPQFSPPEGNAHQGMWSADNKFFVGTDEDFAPYRIDPFEITTGPNAGEYGAGEFGWTVPIALEYNDEQINGPTVYVGTACPAVADDPETPEDESDPGTASQIPDASTLQADPGEEKIAVVLRGTCFFSEKVEQAELKGYDAVIVANHHAGSEAGEFPDAYLCGSLGHDYEPKVNAVCIGHRAFHLLFKQEATYDGADEPSVGTKGEEVRAVAVFDGWGYAHLFNPRSMEEIDTYAVDEAIDKRYANGFGVLSAHEVETDQRRNKHLAYFSWYSAGARVAKFGSNGIREVGYYVEEKGSDFWGVETVKRGKRRPLLLFSDRHFGLYILKYTGKE